MKLFTPFRLKQIRSVIKTKTLRILDVGIAGKSPSLTKRVFPLSHYTALERPQTKDYYLEDNDEREKDYVDDWWFLDLNDDAPASDRKFDVVILAAVLEHLSKRDIVLDYLAALVKRGGCFYIEYPNLRSFKVPKIFYDAHFSHEDEHCNLPSTSAIINCLLKAGFVIESAGVRRDWLVIALTPILVPVRMFLRLLKKQPIFYGGDFYDLMGCADYVLARRK